MLARLFGPRQPMSSDLAATPFPVPMWR